MRAVAIVWVAFFVSVAKAKSFLVETENKGDNSDDLTDSHESTEMAAKGICTGLPILCLLLIHFLLQCLALFFFEFCGLAEPVWGGREVSNDGNLHEIGVFFFLF